MPDSGASEYETKKLHQFASYQLVQSFNNLTFWQNESIVLKRNIPRNFTSHKKRNSLYVTQAMYARRGGGRSLKLQNTPVRTALSENR